MFTILIVVFALLAIAVAPGWPHMRARGWGWYPSGGLGLVVLFLLVALLVGV